MEVSGFVEDLFKRNGIQGGIREHLVRGLEWIGGSITREDEDDKIVDLCTALETLLATKQDAKKGEHIALRMMLLHMHLGQPFFNPAEVLSIYEKRSEVIHGSRRRICTGSDYRTTRMITIEIFRNVLTYIRKNSITRHSRFIASLESDTEALEKCVSWLGQFSGSYYNDIREVAERLLQPKGE